MFSFNKALQSPADHILPIFSQQRPVVPCFVAKFGYNFPIRPNLATKAKDNCDFEQQNKHLLLVAVILLCLLESWDKVSQLSSRNSRLWGTNI
ncbi:hypothetical protein TVAG_431950 [Trichomonas vaginalis G3]|uniref:Uncharacterized protein n=1 Tax=Trichomonas vaginalis (strain ATCC PRA-98 / G3) TaxID=412133 RepID=A2F7Z2_TRIV3|nr:hypothetical protein TVAGG3_0671640 [Trichomonas vaginalis G3]EAX98986.1 hypothetical protein TVAG_431950 [Trichomonas vaginalis G3]KAI5507242.1 hypothetical protein TVAGG3_0671640 [Trichomonas vaginalis G3]|eukprot:XP_001311916.1 hypothetical protein [Trichomonas vaginalis G3]